jgi:tRNA pseudouridine38-40 synthase
MWVMLSRPINTFAAKKGPLRYFLKLAYRGTAFHGWQMQPNAISVQELLNTQLSKILGIEINIMGAGRTDTGVHAKEMFAHFDVEEQIRDKNNLLDSLNKMVSPNVVVFKILAVLDNAHARFDATERAYEYHIHRFRDPFAQDLSAGMYFPMDYALMQKATEMLLFKGDFSSFCKTKSQTKTNICELREAFWKQEGQSWVFYVSADRFLRNMVRAMVGSLVAVGKGKMSLEAFRAMIDAKDRRLAGESAPAQGLYLTRVEYPKDIFIDGRQR